MCAISSNQNRDVNQWLDRGNARQDTQHIMLSSIHHNFDLDCGMLLSWLPAKLMFDCQPCWQQRFGIESPKILHTIHFLDAVAKTESFFTNTFSNSSDHF